MSRFTVKEAAKRVKRSPRTIERWIADKDQPLPVTWWSGVRYVGLDDLLEQLRIRNLADPSKGREAGRPMRVRKHLESKARVC